MEFNLNIPEEQVETIFKAFAEKYNYQEEVIIEDEDFGQKKVPNPETIDMFAKRKVIEHIKFITKEYLLLQARHQVEAVINSQIEGVEIV